MFVYLSRYESSKKSDQLLSRVLLEQLRRQTITEVSEEPRGCCKMGHWSSYWFHTSRGGKKKCNKQSSHSGRVSTGRVLGLYVTFVDFFFLMYLLFPTMASAIQDEPSGHTFVESAVKSERRPRLGISNVPWIMSAVAMKPWLISTEKNNNWILTLVILDVIENQ